MKTPEQWISGDGSLQIHMRALIAEVQADCETSTETKILLKRCYDEILNLQNKLEHNDPEGWEGSKRRLVLKNDLQKFLFSNQICPNPTNSIPVLKNVLPKREE